MIVPDFWLIDAFRGVAVVLGGVLLLVLAYLATHLDGLPARTRQGCGALALLVLPVLLTEAQQIGRPFLVWRLPLAFLAFIGGLRWALSAIRDR